MSKAWEKFKAFKDASQEAMKDAERIFVLDALAEAGLRVGDDITVGNPERGYVSHAGQRGRIVSAHPYWNGLELFCQFYKSDGTLGLRSGKVRLDEVQK